MAPASVLVLRTQECPTAPHPYDLARFFEFSVLALGPCYLSFSLLLRVSRIYRHGWYGGVVGGAYLVEERKVYSVSALAQVGEWGYKDALLENSDCHFLLMTFLFCRDSGTFCACHGGWGRGGGGPYKRSIS